MTSSDQSAKLPMWIFFATDVVLIGAAAWIARHSPQPLNATAILAIVACVITGALVGLVPLVLRSERQKNEALDDRQRALEALARTVSSSAEQISIAASGLHEIAELAQKNLRHADQLPHKLQEKIAEFQAQLTQIHDSEKEEMEKELLALRSSESERLESISDKIGKTGSEWAKLESATHRHLVDATETLAKLSLGTASAIHKAEAAAEQALREARMAAARSLGETSGAALHDVALAKAAALEEIDARLIKSSADFVERVATQLATKVEATVTRLDSKLSAIEAASKALPAVPLTEGPATVLTTPSSPVETPVESPVRGPEATEGTEKKSVNAPVALRRPRKSRREENPPSGAGDATTPPVTITSSDVSPSERHPVAPPALPTPSAEPPSPAPTKENEPLLPEPAPVLRDTIPEIAPAVPPSGPPFHHHLAGSPSAAGFSEPLAPGLTEASKPSSGEKSPPGAEASSAGDSAKAPRKTRPAKKAIDPDEATPTFDLDDSPAPQSAEVGDRTMTSDGATRLVVTAYIGIGNRLFIRGDGPGLSWDKGVPLQFVSIGKWRWESSDAYNPVQFRLYKNDNVECVALGLQTLAPAHQHEVAATF